MSKREKSYADKLAEAEKMVADERKLAEAIGRDFEASEPEAEKEPSVPAPWQDLQTWTRRLCDQCVHSDLLDNDLQMCPICAMFNDDELIGVYGNAVDHHPKVYKADKGTKEAFKEAFGETVFQWLRNEQFLRKDHVCKLFLKKG